MSREHGAIYEIRLKGVLDDRWSEWFDGMTLSTSETGETTLSGPVADQAALHGLLTRVRDLGVPLLSVRRQDANRLAIGPTGGHCDVHGKEKDQ